MLEKGFLNFIKIIKKKMNIIISFFEETNLHWSHQRMGSIRVLKALFSSVSYILLQMLVHEHPSLFYLIIK